jgi:hypothetical protein
MSEATFSLPPDLVRRPNWVLIALGVYLVGFLLTWPRVFLIADEERYVTQAVAFASGGRTLPGAELLTDASPRRVVIDYPPGTSLLQVPFVRVGGWRAAALVSVVSLLVATWITARAIIARGGAAEFALLIPGFLGTAFFGRIAMSDVPSAALVAAVLGVVIPASTGSRLSVARSLVLGGLIGASLLFRETVTVLLLPIAVGVALRGQVHVPALVVGALIAVSARLLLSAALFGSALHVRDSGYGFAFDSLRHTLPMYGIILLAMIPMGAVLPFRYRGRYRAELCAGLAAYVSIFLFYEYNSIAENGTVKGLMLAARYMVPTTPVLALMAADVWPRWAAPFIRRGSPLPRVAGGVAIAGVVTLCAGIHIVARSQEEVPLAIKRNFYSHTTATTPVVVNSKASLKYLSPSYGRRRIIERDSTDAVRVAALVRRDGPVTVAFLERSDSEMFRQDVAANDRFLGGLLTACVLEERARERVAAWASLRVVAVVHCASG